MRSTKTARAVVEVVLECSRTIPHHGRSVAMLGADLFEQSNYLRIADADQFRLGASCKEFRLFLGWLNLHVESTLRLGHLCGQFTGRGKRASQRTT